MKRRRHARGENTSEKELFVVKTSPKKVSLFLSPTNQVAVDDHQHNTFKFSKKGGKDKTQKQKIFFNSENFKSLVKGEFEILRLCEKCIKHCVHLKKL